ncbi:bpX6 domain-containing protein [Xanthomonas sp. NCPPB 2865]|uniref:bpX6 domain-containing protein n=1 Tax=unclassified Xanthomonas TaxID=2643310 RepID=UPI001CF8435F|nr:bpX6 domain-containing protein [Xanthomonas sp. MWU16-30325]
MTSPARTDNAGGSVRYPLWHGSQMVSALWFSAAWLGPEQRLARLVRAWQPGSRALRFADGDVLCFAAPRALVCEQAPGLALCQAHGGLFSGALTAAEAAQLPPADIGLVHGAQVIALQWHQALPLDPAEAIDMTGYPLHTPYDCSPSAPPLEVDRLRGKPLRQLLGDAVPPASAERDAFLRALKTQRPEVQNSTLWQRLLARAQRTLGSAHAPASNRSAATGQRTHVPARRDAAAVSAWRTRLARALVASRLAGLVGHRQGAYMRRMLRQFENGDLDEALRNALPLDGVGESLGQAFGVPQRRSDLSLSRTRGAGTRIGLGEDLQAHLRATYRSAFARLDREGQIDRAVFVLAELLNARHEALDYLVKHARYTQAAELALGWDMPAAMTIRLLMLAGDHARAVQVARRDGAFAAAIQLLHGTDRALADALRLEWGQALVQAGDLLAAVDAVWPLHAARNQAAQWLLAAEQAGSTLRARALVKRAQLLPDTLEHYAERIAALADPTADAAPRSEMAAALLVDASPNRSLQQLARQLLPAIAADHAFARNSLSVGDLTTLLKLAKDPLLSADIPAFKPRAATSQSRLWEGATTVHLQAPQAGLAAIHDVAALPDRRYLLALGEAGAAVVDAHGRLLRRYPAPAFGVVIADSGQVALAIAPRERVSTVHRLDLITHAMRDLGQIALQYAAPSYSGIGWSIVVDNRLLVVDTDKDLHSVLWHVGDLPGPVIAAGFFSDCEVYLVQACEQLEDWTYSLPERRLKARDPLRVDPQTPVLAHRLGSVQQADVRTDPDGDICLHYQHLGNARQCRLHHRSDASGAPDGSSVVALELGFLVGLHWPHGARYFLVRHHDGGIVASLDWPAGIAVKVREQPGHLLLHDAHGRLLDLQTDRSLTHALSFLG